MCPSMRQTAESESGNLCAWRGSSGAPPAHVVHRGGPSVGASPKWDTTEKWFLRSIRPRNTCQCAGTGDVTTQAVTDALWPTSGAVRRRTCQTKPAWHTAHKARNRALARIAAGG